MLQQARAAGINGHSVHHTAHTTPLQCFKVINIGWLHRLFLCGGNNSAGNGMFRIPLQPCGQRQRFVFLYAIYHSDVDHALFPFGQRTGLIKDNRIQFAGRFQRQPVANQDAVARRQRGGDSHYQRHGQAQGMGTGDDQYGDDTLEYLHVEAGSDNPDDGRQYRRSQRRIEEERCGPVGQQLRLGFAGLRLFHQTHDAGERRLITSGRDLNAQTAAAFVDGAADGAAATLFLHQLRLAGNHRFVDVGTAVVNFPVGRNAGTRADQHPVPRAKLRHGNGFGLAILVNAFCFVWHQLRQLIQRPGGLAYAAHFQPVAQQHHVNQGHQLPEEALSQVEKQGSDAVDEGHRDGQRNQSHHARLAVAQLPGGHLQEGQTAVDENHHGQHRRDPGATGEAWGRVAQPALQRRAEEQHRQAEQQRHPEAVAEHFFVPGVAAVAAVAIVFFVLCVAVVVHWVFGVVSVVSVG